MRLLRVRIVCVKKNRYETWEALCLDRHYGHNASEVKIRWKKKRRRRRIDSMRCLFFAIPSHRLPNNSFSFHISQANDRAGEQKKKISFIYRRCAVVVHLSSVRRFSLAPFRFIFLIADKSCFVVDFINTNIYIQTRRMRPLNAPTEPYHFVCLITF